jgi:predicted NBD/HSP70 family sugar kinase
VRTPPTPAPQRRLSRDSLRSSLPLLRLLEHDGQLSQLDAARRLSLTPGACNLHFLRLEQEKLVHRANLVNRGGKGRPTIVWDIDRTSNTFLVFIFDVPFFQAALLDFAGQPLLEQRFDLSRARTRGDVEAAIETFTCAALALAARNSLRVRQVVGGFPGLLDPSDGSVRHAVNFPALDGLNLAALFGRHHLPAWSASLSLCFFFGETAGQAVDATTLVVHWDLGVGVICGRGDSVLSIQLDRDGVPEIPEVGHICIAPGGRPCPCGRRGCLEAYSGGQAMVTELADADIRSLGALIHALQAGRKDSLRLARRAARTLGCSLAWPVQLMGVEQIVVTGPISVVFDTLSGAFCQGLADTLPPALAQSLTVQASPDPRARLRAGAFRLAKRLFLDPDSMARLPRSPAQLS